MGALCPSPRFFPGPVRSTGVSHGTHTDIREADPRVSPGRRIGRHRQAGVIATVYEGNTRLGGRCWSIRGAFDDGQIAEHGGELIDQYHKEIRNLAQELGLDLENLLAAEQNGTEPFYYFDGRRQTFAETTDAVKKVWQVLHADLSAASYPTTYNSFTAAGYALDHMSILQWIESRVPGG